MAETPALGSVRAMLRRDRAIDVGCYLLAALYALPSFAYPLGGDSAFYRYIGQAWLNGRWPYVGAVDHTPPGFFYVQAACLLIFGDREWPLRAVELAVLLAQGFMVGRILHAHEPGKPALGG